MVKKKLQNKRKIVKNHVQLVQCFIIFSFGHKYSFRSVCNMTCIFSVTNTYEPCSFWSSFSCMDAVGRIKFKKQLCSTTHGEYLFWIHFCSDNESNHIAVTSLFMFYCHVSVNNCASTGVLFYCWNHIFNQTVSHRNRFSPSLQFHHSLLFSPSGRQLVLISV